MNGFLLHDKPQGFSSNQALESLRKKIGIRRMGHTGTLDPFATGLLIVAVGEASKFIPYLQTAPKLYEAVLKLGTATDTLDFTGKIIQTAHVPVLEKSMVEKKAALFLGRQMQVPPMFSAKKTEGKRHYDLARQGIEVERKPCAVEIFELQIREVAGERVHFQVSCSGGTYIRVLGAELAKALGTVGHLVELRRLTEGPYQVKEASESIIPIEKMLGHLPLVEVDAAEGADLRLGRKIKPSSAQTAPSFVVVKNAENFLGVGEWRDGFLWPKRLIQ
jgi:tRNA pseudouridine55 synthase